MRTSFVVVLRVLAAVQAATHLHAQAVNQGLAESQDAALVGQSLADQTLTQEGGSLRNLPQPDPNGLLFLVRFETDVFATPYVHGAIEILRGDPVQMAILVNNSDLSSALWQPYSSFDVTLGPADGRFEVWVGLKNRSGALGQTASMTPLRLDRVPPVIVIIPSPIPPQAARGPRLCQRRFAARNARLISGSWNRVG
jgi:hypothetical protein